MVIVLTMIMVVMSNKIKQKKTPLFKVVIVIAHCCAIFLWRLGNEISISFSWATNYSIALSLSVSMLGSQVYIWLIVPPSHNNAFIILVGLQLTYVQNRDISTVAKLRVKSLSKRAKFVIKRTY